MVANEHPAEPLRDGARHRGRSDARGNATVLAVTATGVRDPLAGRDNLHVDAGIDLEAMTEGAKRRAAAEYKQAMGDGVPLLTTNQSRVLNRLLQLGQTGAHAYGLSQDLGIKEETVRSALASLKTKGLVENGALSPSSMGPARHVFHVVDPQRASNAITAEKDRRDRKIEELSQRLAALTRS